MTDLVLDPGTEQRLNDLSNSTGKTPAEIIREALKTYAEDLEDVIAADEALDRIESGEESTITLTELERRLDLGC
jgi:RHH-type rel operon transcriptional repressor/antitoxin RelB